MGGEVTPAAASTNNPTISKVLQFLHRCLYNVNLIIFGQSAASPLASIYESVMIFFSIQSAQWNGEDFKDKHPISGREKHIKILYVYVSKLENSNNLSSM